jgi:hypothetical protein
MGKDTNTFQILISQLATTSDDQNPEEIKDFQCEIWKLEFV